MMPSDPNKVSQQTIHDNRLHYHSTPEFSNHIRSIPTAGCNTDINRTIPIMPLATSSSETCVNLRSTRNSAVAGYVAGFVGVALGHPLDSLKVWAQTSSLGNNTNPHWATANSNGNTSASNTVVQLPKGVSTNTTTNMLIRSSPRNIGTASMSTMVNTTPFASIMIPTAATFQPSWWLTKLRALYSGASGPLVTVGLVQSINFSTYDGVRRVLHRYNVPDASRDDYLHHDTLWNVGIAGFVAGTGLAFITSPLIMVKTHQQITGVGFRQAFRDTLFRSNGRWNLSGCFVGFYPHYLSETIGRSIYYCTYEACKRYMIASKARQQQEQGWSPTISLTERMVAAATAGISCWTIIFPLDALRNRLYSQAGQIQSGGASQSLSTLEMARLMYSERSLYRGFSLTVLRAGPVAATVLPVYDLVLEQLSS